MLADLATEIIEHIAGFLCNDVPPQPPDIRSLRLVCRDLHRKLDKIFAKTYFGLLKVDLSPASLQWLGHVAERDRLAQAVHTIYICNGEDKGASSLKLEVIGHGNSWPRTDNGVLDLDSAIIQGLISTICRFSSCTTFALSDTEGRTRGGPPAEDPKTYLSPLDLLRLFIAIMAEETAPPIRTFHAHSRMAPWSTYPAGQYSAGSLAMSPACRKRWSTCIENLVFDLHSDEEKVRAIVLNLISSAGSLRTLRFLDYKSTTRTLPTALVPPTLAELTLTSMAISQSTFTGLLDSCRESLTRLHLFGGLDITNGTWRSILAHLRDENFTKLRHLSIYACYQGGHTRVLLFCPLRIDLATLTACVGTFTFSGRPILGATPKIRAVGVRYTSRGAEDMGQALQGMHDLHHILNKGSRSTSPGYPAFRFAPRRQQAGEMEVDRMLTILGRPHLEDRHEEWKWTGMPTYEHRKDWFENV